MLVSISPAVAAENAPTRPTIEEILDEYHKAAFEAQYIDEVDATTTCSPRSGNKTLEQETVDALNTAGYEAYNVTSANYKTLESQLNTNFSDMGLDLNSSYIIIIHGGEAANNTAYGITPRSIVPDLNLTGVYSNRTNDDSFTYTYNGITYTMRYMTITSRDDPRYAKSSDYNLRTNYYDTFLDRLLDATVSTYLDTLNKHVYLGTFLSILGISDYANRYKTSNSSLTYFANTQWTRTYIQVWSNPYEYWYYAACSEYVDMESKISGYIFDTTLNDFIDVNDKQISKREYSSNYFNYEQRKLDAILGYTRNTTKYDVVGNIRYTYNNTTVAYHPANFI